MGAADVHRHRAPTLAVELVPSAPGGVVLGPVDLDQEIHPASREAVARAGTRCEHRSAGLVVPTADESPKMARCLDGAQGLLTSLRANGMADFHELGRFAGRVMSMSAAMPRVRLHLTAVYCVLTNRSLVSSPALPDCRPWWTRGASSGARLVRSALAAPLIKAIEVILGLLTSGRVFPWKTQRHM